MNINIEIGDVVLEGVNFSESQSLELRQELQRNLTSVLAARAERATRAQSTQVDRAVVQLHPGSPRDLGSNLAHSIDHAMHEQRNSTVPS